MRPSVILFALSASRIVASPFVAAAVVTGRYLLALVLCAGAGVTDALDGYLARRWNATSRWGADLDSIGDKALVSVAYLSLGWTGDMPLWLVVLVFSRDVLILAAAMMLRRFAGVESFEHSLWGKIATQIHVLTLAMVMLRGAVSASGVALAASVLIWLAGAGTLWSGIDYAIRGARLACQSRN